MERDQTKTHMERHISLARPECESLDEALAWVVRMIDTEFAGASMLKITVEQIGRMYGDESEFSYPWTAAIAGHYEEPVTDGRLT